MSEPIRLGLRFDHGFAEARAFLDALGGISAPFTFQTFVDRAKGDPPARGDSRNQIITGVFDDHYKTLARLNNQRAGVFVTVNPQRGPGRSDANTARPRAIWHENDGAIPDNVEQLWPLPPSMVVRTRANHTHTYWLLDYTEGSPENWSLWEGIERHLVEHRRSDPNAMKRCQVLRIPDYFHVKDIANHNLVRLAQHPTGRRYTLAELAEVFPPSERPRAVTGPTTLELDTHGIQDLPSVTETDWRDVVEALRYINPDAAAVPSGDGGGTRGRWLRVLMALEETKHPDRRLVADEWSRNGGVLDRGFPAPANLVSHAGYVEGEVEYQMQSFRRADGNKVGLGSLFAFAKQGGWPGWKHSGKQEDDVWAVDPPEEVAATTLFHYTRGDEALAKPAPPQDFLIDQFLAGDGTFAAIAGRGGIGKSKFVLGVAASIASGTPAFGYHPLVPPVVGSAVMLDLENSPHEFSRRLQDHTRAMITHGLLHPDQASEVMTRVHHVYIDKMMFPLAFGSLGTPTRHNANWNAVYTELSRIRDRSAFDVRWVCFDALYKFHALNENDNMQMIVAIEQLNELVDRVFGKVPRAAVHHSRKGANVDYWKDDGGALRGAGAVEAAMRSVVTLRHLDESECKTLGIGKDQRREFAIVQVAKSNYQVMKPDNFMVRSFYGAWWWTAREPVSPGFEDAGGQDMLDDAFEGKFQKFLVDIHAVLRTRDGMLTPNGIADLYARRMGLSGRDVKEMIEKALVDGYIREVDRPLRGRGKIAWLGPRVSDPPICGLDELGV